jgi:DNA repair ATPase RecN
MGWFWQMNDLPQMPHAHHLAPLFAQHEFQEAFKNYRDLRYLTQNLQEWRDKLSVFSDMLDTRTKAFAQRLPQVQERSQGINLNALLQRRDALTADVAAGASQATGEAFADARQRDLMVRLARVQAAVAASDPALDGARQTARLAAGALTWQLAQEFPERVWNATKQLREIDAQLAQAQARNQALSDAQRDEPARFAAFAKRIAALEPLLQVMIPKVAELTALQQAAVQDIAVAELNEQKQRLVAYSTQARFAVAQLYDRANGHHESDHAPTQP